MTAMRMTTLAKLRAAMATEADRRLLAASDAMQARHRYSAAESLRQLVDCRGPNWSAEDAAALYNAILGDPGELPRLVADVTDQWVALPDPLRKQVRDLGAGELADLLDRLVTRLMGCAR